MVVVNESVYLDKKFVRGFFENDFLAMLLLDKYGHVLMANQVFCQDLGFDIEEVQYKSITCFMSLTQAQAFNENMQILKDSIVLDDVELLSKNNKPIIYKWSCQVLSPQQIGEDVQLAISLKKESSNEKFIEYSHLSQIEQINQILSNGKGLKSFFDCVTHGISEFLDIPFVVIGEYKEENYSINALSVWANDCFEDNIKYELIDTPCESVIEKKRFQFFNGEVKLDFPNLNVLSRWNAESYLGVPLLDTYQNTIGVLYVIDNKPLENENINLLISALQIFANGISTEIENNRNNQSQQSVYSNALHKVNIELENYLDSIWEYKV